MILYTTVQKILIGKVFNMLEKLSVTLYKKVSFVN